MPIAHEVLLEILRDACRAPSADNTQPWRFVLRGNTVRVVNTGDQIESVFNYRQQVNYVGLGACVENLRISAEGRGFKTRLHLFPDANDISVVAAITLTSDVTAYNHLAPFIKNRTSNRKRYHPRSIEPEKLNEFAALEEGGGRIAFVTGERVKTVAHIVSIGEKLTLQTKSIHNFLFKHVTWSKEDDTNRHGFYIETFEFTPLQKTIFKLFRNWNILKFFIPLGFPNFVARDMEKIYATSGAFGVILAKNNSAEDYVRIGMLFERLWLTAAKLGLALQPTSGLNFFSQPVLDGHTFDLDDASIALVRERYRELQSIFDARKGETIGIAFRLGYADAPSALTTRFEPVVESED